MVLHERCSQAVFSHEEAFYFHGLTDLEPLIHTLTVYSGYNAQRIKAAGCKVYSVLKSYVSRKDKDLNQLMKNIDQVTTRWSYE